jgi:hypothetical protein
MKYVVASQWILAASKGFSAIDFMVFLFYHVMEAEPGFEVSYSFNKN